MMQLFGFYEEEDEEDEYSEYEEEPQFRGRGRSRDRDRDRDVKKNRAGRKEESRVKPTSPSLVFFKGVPSEDIKLRLRDVLLDGAMVLLDLQGLDKEHREEGNSFLQFMGGVAFAHRGQMEHIGPFLFVITPREGMLEYWPGEE
jgi:FtsZ-interacting cell division protein YlmF